MYSQKFKLSYFLVGMEGKGVNWWGTDGEHCELAFCPTAKGIVRGEARILV